MRPRTIALVATIRPDAPLRTVGEIKMHGRPSLGTKAEPVYRPMRACQLLAAPHGFIWQVRIGEGASRVIGSDAAFPGGSWTRFWLAGLVPVARQGGDADHARSSFGRYMGEAIFWTPAALVPSKAVRWESLGDDAESSARLDAPVEGFMLTERVRGAVAAIVSGDATITQWERLFGNSCSHVVFVAPDESAKVAPSG